VALRFLLQYLKKTAALKKLREARAALLNTLPKKATPSKILHVVLYALPDLQPGSEPRTRLDSILERANAAYPCISASLNNYGSKKMDKSAFLAFLGKPDMSLGMSHALVMTADDTTSLKIFLHSNLHKGEYYATGAPFFRGCTEITTDLAVDLNPEGKEDPILQLVLIRFKDEVTDDSEVFQTLVKAVDQFNQVPGIGAALRPTGHSTLIKQDLISELAWNDSSAHMSHLLTVVADSPQHLKDLQESECYGKWLMTEMPQLKQAPGLFPAIIFYAPLKVTAQC